MHQIEISNPHLKVDGVQLELCPEIDEVDTCEGCFFNILDRDGYMQCTIPISINSATALCANQHMIWLPIAFQPKEQFSVEEVVSALDYLIHPKHVDDHMIQEIEKKIKRKRDPEYAEYLRLKAKFE